MNKKLLNWLAFASLFTFLAGCQSDEVKNARLEVWLTDAPGDYQQVNIDIQDVLVSNSESAQGGWVSLNVQKGVYDLKKLTNGLDTLLGEVEIPAGKISQIRLVLGENNTVKIDNKIYALNTPSAQQSGLKLQIHETFNAGVTYKILLDFDAARSIVATGSGKYNLKPVIKSMVSATSGAIKGIVDPKESTPAIYAITGADTVGTTYSDTTGHFLLRGIPAGTYSIHFVPATGYDFLQKDNVTVQTGVVTDMGTVQISN